MRLALGVHIVRPAKVAAVTMAEYQVEDFLELLDDADSLRDSLANDRAMLDAALWYCTDKGVKTLAEAIRRTDTADRKRYVGKLMSIYPLSSKVIDTLVFSDRSSEALFDEDEVVGWFDVGQILVNSLVKFRNLSSSGSSAIKQERQKYESFIEKYNRDMQALEAQMREIDEMAQSRREKMDELDALERDVISRRNKWSEEAISRREQELRAELKRYDTQESESRSRLQKLQEELDSYRADESLVGALEALSNAIEKLPKDYTD